MKYFLGVAWAFCHTFNSFQVPADGVPVEGELDIAVDFTAPELPGRYISYWRMSSPSGVKFGQRVWVLIQVLLVLESIAISFEAYAFDNLVASCKIPS